MLKISVICSLPLVYIILCVNADVYPTNKIKQGTLNGKYMNSRNGQQFSAYLSIPYAEPPVGALRFKAPVAARSWKGDLDASKPHAICPQPDMFREATTIIGNENCLYLNVFTPQLRSSEKELYPVMIFIHGGGYYYGAGLAYDPDFLLDESVILVTFNYRLGPLGFLTTGDEVVPGNNGLKDQTMAIKWVHDNIKAFGGDPNKITLFGESAGGASVHLHIFSPLSQGLFNQAISQSGTAFNTWAFGETKRVVENSKRLAQLVECPVQDHYKMVDCLQSVDAYKIIDMTKHFHEWDMDPMIPFRPITETDHTNAFLSQHPVDILRLGKFANVPWVAGINSEEGVIRASGIFKNPQLLKEINEDFNRIMSITFDNTADNFDEISSKIRNFYFGNKGIDASTKWNLINMYSDMMFVMGHDTAVRLHYQHSKQPVYNFFYSHQGAHSLGRIIGDNSFRYGVCHGDELFLQFPFAEKFQLPQLDELDKHVSHLLIKLWTDFAKTSDPTPELNSIIATKWKPLESNDLEYFYIGSGVHIVKNLYSERLKFWKSLNILPNSKNIKDEL